jgi:hypothetical protein
MSPDVAHLGARCRRPSDVKITRHSSVRSVTVFSGEGLTCRGFLSQVYATSLWQIACSSVDTLGIIRVKSARNVLYRVKGK